MKEFKKTENGLFVCEECEKLCKNCLELSKHIKRYHNYQNYYDKWLKTEGEGICKICGEKTTFLDKRYEEFNKLIAYNNSI